MTTPHSTVSNHPSTSGLQIALHPLALLTVSDYITRHTLRNGKGPIIGALLGTQSGREIAIENAYELLVLSDPQSPATVERAFFENKLSLFKETHPTQDLVGWFSTATTPGIVPSDMHTAVHQQLLEHNESLIMLLLNPQPAAAIGGKLPLTIYESIYEADDAEPSNPPHLKFVPLKYGIETGEAEMIAMDVVARGAGNAADNQSGAAAAAAPPGKGKAAAERSSEKPGAVSDGVSPQNADLLANLQAKKNAVVMLNSRIKLLLSYLQDPPAGVINQGILREIKSLTHSRLPLLTPADAGAYEREKVAEETDVNLVVLLGALTKSIEQVRNVGKKFQGIEMMTKAKGKQGGFEDVVEGFGLGRERRRGMDRGGFPGFG